MIFLKHCDVQKLLIALQSLRKKESSVFTTQAIPICSPTTAPPRKVRFQPYGNSHSVPCEDTWNLPDFCSLFPLFLFFLCTKHPIYPSKMNLIVSFPVKSPLYPEFIIPFTGLLKHSIDQYIYYNNTYSLIVQYSTFEHLSPLLNYELLRSRTVC